MTEQEISAAKKALRQELMKKRRNMDKNYKEFLDEKIYTILKSSSAIKEAKVILTYASSPIEVDTRRLIKFALSEGKTVAVPKCEGKNMRFLSIKSLSELTVGSHGVEEPVDGEEITDFSDSVCVTPALRFDEKGYRLGYGGGFYDRFLRNYSGTAIGICYDEFCGSLPVGEFDISLERVITEKGFFCGKEDFCGR